MEERIKPCCRGLWGHKKHERGYTAGLTAVTQPPSSTAPLQTGLGRVPYLLGCQARPLEGDKPRLGGASGPLCPGLWVGPGGLSYALREAPLAKPCWSPGLATRLSPAWPATGLGQDTPGNGCRKTGKG